MAVSISATAWAASLAAVATAETSATPSPPTGTAMASSAERGLEPGQAVAPGPGLLGRLGPGRGSGLLLLRDHGRRPGGQCLPVGEDVAVAGRGRAERRHLVALGGEVAPGRLGCALEPGQGPLRRFEPFGGGVLGRLGLLDGGIGAGHPLDEGIDGGDVGMGFHLAGQAAPLSGEHLQPGGGTGQELLGGGVALLRPDDGLLTVGCPLPGVGQGTDRLPGGHAPDDVIADRAWLPDLEGRRERVGQVPALQRLERLGRLPGGGDRNRMLAPPEGFGFALPGDGGFGLGDRRPAFSQAGVSGARRLQRAELRQRRPFGGPRLAPGAGVDQPGVGDVKRRLAGPLVLGELPHGPRHGDGLQPPDPLRRLLGPAQRGLLRLHQRSQGGLDGGHLGGELADVQAAVSGGVEGLGGGEGVLLELGVDETDLAAGLGFQAPGRPAELGVDLEVEQPQQQLPAFVALGSQEPGEVALGERHAAGEVIEAQPEEADDGGRHLPFEAGHDLGATGGGPFEPGLLGADHALRGAAGDPGGDVVLAGQLEVEPDLGLRPAEAHHVADEILGAVAGDAAVEGEADGVEDRRLARAGRPDQGEEVGVVEDERGGGTEGSEPGQLEAEQPHTPTPPTASPAAWDSSRSRLNSRTTRSSSTPWASR